MNESVEASQEEKIEGESSLGRWGIQASEASRVTGRITSVRKSTKSGPTGIERRAKTGLREQEHTGDSDERSSA